MKVLQERILKSGLLKENNILKVDSFLNHQIDPLLLEEICNEFIKYTNGKKIDKILTIEASGIAIATILGLILKVNVLFAKKATKEPNKDDNYVTEVYSYTHNIKNYVYVAKKYLNKDENIFIVDDFLANGEALLGLIDLCEQAEASIKGLGIVIEKSFQKGRNLVLEKGYDLYSLARIKKLDYENNLIEFVEDEDE